MTSNLASVQLPVIDSASANSSGVSWAAVIGGASLFGGHGKPIHPVLGGLVIATLTNGLALLNISTAGTDIATAAVLLVAVAVDSTLRRRGRSGEA